VLSTPLALDDQVDVVFTNDYKDSTTDRNLWVESVQAAGQTIRTESDAVTYDTGAGAAAFDGQGVYPGLRMPNSGGLMVWGGALRMRARTRYTYDKVGNLTGNADLPLSYPAGGAASVRPHAPTAVGGFSYSYDANGSLLSGGGRSLTWTAENLPASITGPDSVAETYGYNGDGERVTGSRAGQTTLYPEGLWEETLGGSTRVAYALNGAVVAQRDSAAGLLYLHSDSLGSVSIASDAAGAVVSRQTFTPWGAVRSGGISQTSANYTGQRLDKTGLLYYHARMYDPVVGRFLSADSIVPASASGSMDGVALKPLTVDFHETGFASALGGENQQPFWFQMSDKQRQKAGELWGPANPQALNRYSYVQNNPLKYTDPTGHTWYLSKADAKAVSTALRRFASEIKSGTTFAGSVTGLLTKLWSASGLVKNSLAGNFFRAIMTGLADAAVAVVVGGVGIGFGFSYAVGEDLNNLANRIDDYTGDDGIAIATDDNGMYFLNRTDGSAIYWEPGVSASGSWLLDHMPDSMRLGARPVGGGAWWEKWHFTQDEQWVHTQTIHL
jgi:RHS repeat-associated protein